MFKTARRMRKGPSPIFAVLLGTISVASGLIMGDTSSSSFGASAEKSFQQLMHEAMTVMDRGMENAPMTGDPDRDFAAMMIPHHRGAIDMAKAELLYGKNPVLRRLAQEIIVTQDSEITVMRMELQKQPVGGSPSR